MLTVAFIIAAILLGVGLVAWITDSPERRDR